MNKRVVLSLLALFFFTFSYAQAFTLTGKLQDAENRAPIQGATVVLRSIKDSSHIATAYTDTAGRFQFDEIARDSFRLIISSVGFETLTRNIKIDSADVHIGNIALPRSSKELTGVTIQSRIPPAQQKGDTIQFNASQYKVNPDASAEDLAKKIPGITVEDGQVKAQGENVKRVTIDGRELFGDDATAALRNLPAEIIDKIQVFDKLSDQAQFSGFDDGNSQKEINIVTKANMRNGQFGRLFGGYGTDNRYQAGGNTTILKGTRRISLVGNFNNINQQNFSQQDLLGVTSNAQRGGGGGGRRGGGGGPRGGSGNRQQGGGNQGGGNNGGFGSSANFLVGQQNGINKTNAAGINFSDQWGKNLILTGSYFFNNNNNTINEQSNRQYFLNGIPNYNENNIATSNNNNHRINIRLEYKIDSANQLTITPSLSFQNNQNSSQRTTSTFFGDAVTGQKVSDINNNTNSHRNGNNLNNTILYRHSFAKRGRTFSINLNTSYNDRGGETYQENFRRTYNNGTTTDSLDQQLTNQQNNGYQLSTNLVYTEPLGKKSQLQFNYNPTYAKSKADQETMRYNMDDKLYNQFDSSLSNKFENITKTQNAGVSYRLGNRDKQLSFGLNYQQSTLNSDQTFPRILTVNKNFNNLLPNAMLRYKLNDRSNIRLMYRANTSQPSVTQLQDVADRTNAPIITAGNPNLEQQYTHVLSTRYTYTNTSKGILFVANIFGQKANNYIANATSVPQQDSVIGFKQTIFRGEQLNMPVNLDGYTSLRSFVTFAVPVKFIKSNLNLNGGVSYNKFPGIINNISNESENMTYSLGTVIGSNISQYVDFNVSYSANFNTVKNALEPKLNNSYFNHVAGLQLNLLNKTGWFLQNDLNNRLYNGLSEGFNQNFWLWNLSAGKKFLKDKKGELKLSVFDLLKQNQSIQRNVTETYIEDNQNQVLQQYFMLTFTYNLRNFGAATTATKRVR